jgi:SAM-dependent methyltransferase
MEMAKEAFCQDISNKRVLEIGSHDVNGTIRKIFSGSLSYLGADLAPGPGVDIVCSGHELNLPDASYDVVLSCECFEHNPYWKETFSNMARMATPNGYVILTCASTGRIEHGTSRTKLAHSPGTAVVGIDYYRNLTEEDFEAVFDLRVLFSEYRFWHISASCDLYFVGRLHGEATDQAITADFSDSVSDLENLSVRARGPLRQALFRMYRAPLDALAARVSDERYQDFAVRYQRLRSLLK